MATSIVLLLWTTIYRVNGSIPGLYKILILYKSEFRPNWKVVKYTMWDQGG